MDTPTVRLVEGPRPRLELSAPLSTEVVEEHGVWVTGSKYEPEQGIVIEMDVRRGPWKKILALPRGREVHWADVRTVDIRELSNTRWPIIYRLTYGDGWYTGKSGDRCYFPLQEHLRGIDLARRATTVTIRAAVLLAVVGGVGLRTVCWLMKLLFNADLSKSGVDRWVRECADQLPEAAEMAKALHADKPITDAHFDEIFRKGERPKRCTLVLRDQYGRIFAIKEIEERTAETVKTFLQEVKSWGLALRVFYVDGCEAYREAILAIFPDAIIQYDYFHVIQNIFRKLWKAVVARRKEIKKEAETTRNKARAEKLLELAKRIWEKRYLFFTRDENLTRAEKREMTEVIEQEGDLLGKVRSFIKHVRSIFDKSDTEAKACYRLATLRDHEGVEPGSPFEKVIGFLDDRFLDMIAFLSHDEVQRHSLAETGIRCLRRLEQGHDGFRGPEGMDCYLRLYQAIKYLGWTVHSFTPGLGLPPGTVTVPTAGGPPPPSPPPAPD